MKTLRLDTQKESELLIQKLFYLVVQNAFFPTFILLINLVYCTNVIGSYSPVVCLCFCSSFMVAGTQ